jgi:DUF1009 family protein
VVQVKLKFEELQEIVVAALESRGYKVTDPESFYIDCIAPEGAEAGDTDNNEHFAVIDCALAPVVSSSY